MTREANRKQYGDTAQMDLEEYLTGVVPSEMNDSSPHEALKAQAIAARTYALGRIRKGQEVDDTANCQAFRCERMGYPRSRQAVYDTAGVVLMYDGALVQAYYSNSNGGVTKRSGDVWRTHLPYYLNRDDSWDAAARAARPSIKVSHGVGLSQVGAAAAAAQGFSCEEILAFYYQETTLAGKYGTEKEEMKAANVKASDLIREFQRMIGWKYEWGAAREGCVDCSGAFSYAYKKLGSSMYHGSNTMWRKYTTEKGILGSIALVPGMAVFKWRANGGPDSLGDYYHVGLYIGDGQVIEAQSASTGCVISNIGKWHSAAKLTNTVYDVTEGGETDIAVQCKAQVVTEQGSLNLRESPQNGKVLIRIPQNTVIDVLAWDSVPGWAKVVYNGVQGYASQEFLVRQTLGDGKVTVRMTFHDAGTAEQTLAILRDALDTVQFVQEAD